MTIPNDGFFLKSFLIDSTVNTNDSAILPDYVGKHIHKFIGKPLILTDYLAHPREFYEVPEGPDHEENIRMYLELQKKYEIGNIIDVRNSTSSRNEYEALVELTNPRAIRLFKTGKLPHYVSPSIYRLNPNDHTSAITDYEPINLTIVDSPAYGCQVAECKKPLRGTRSGCQRMLLQSAGIKKSNKSRNIIEIDEGIETLLTNITTLQKQVDDLVSWKETTEIKSDQQKLLKRLSDIDKLLEFGGGS